MDSRKQKLLLTIIREYIATADPVGSKLLVEKYDFGVSSATVRNAMAELEKEGYIYQPHTSAGRVPTEKAYQYYVDNFLKPKKPRKNEILALTRAIKAAQYERGLKDLAKIMAGLAEQTVIVAFSQNDVYYTGISYLFNKPEFNSPDLIVDLSSVVDAFDEVVNDIFNKITETQVLIGEQNPFSAQCSVVLTYFQLDRKRRGLIGLLGPMRMDYEGNVALLNHARDILCRI